MLSYVQRIIADNLFCAQVIEQTTDRVHIAAPSRRTEKKDLTTWHMRMGHASKSVVAEMCTEDQYKMYLEKPAEENCHACDIASQTKSAMKGKLVTDDNGITIHTDICGPLEV